MSVCTHMHTHTHAHMPYDGCIRYVYTLQSICYIYQVLYTLRIYAVSAIYHVYILHMLYIMYIFSPYAIYHVYILHMLYIICTTTRCDIQYVYTLQYNIYLLSSSHTLALHLPTTAPPPSFDPLLNRFDGMFFNMLFFPFLKLCIEMGT